MGKTAASILFVADVERFIAMSKAPFAIGLLIDQVNKIKSGEEVLTEMLSPEAFVLRAQQG